MVPAILNPETPHGPSIKKGSHGNLPQIKHPAFREPLHQSWGVLSNGIMKSNGYSKRGVRAGFPGLRIAGTKRVYNPNGVHAHDTLGI
jgi:hypothetical protein